MSWLSCALSPDMDSMKAFVPERAMVPILLTTSSRVMPMPLSEIVRVPFSLSTVSRIARSLWSS